MADLQRAREPSDHEVIRASVERVAGPLVVGLYTSTTHLGRLLRSRESGAWARAIAAREVFFDPMPPWMAVAAGAGAVRAAAEHSRSVLARIGAPRILDPLVRKVRSITDRVGAVDLGTTLGFDPLELLARFMKDTHPEEPSDDDVDEPW